MTNFHNRPPGLLLYSAWDIFWIRWDHILSTVRSKFSLRLQHCSYGSHFLTSGSCSFKARTAASIRLGNHVTLNAYWRSNRVGLTTPVLLQTFDNGFIHIGDYSGASAAIISARTSVQIGKHVLIGGNTKILDHDFHSLTAKHRLRKDEVRFIKSAPITIEDEVFIGADCIILRGTIIGKGAVVGAGSVVATHIPSGEIWAGNPARCIHKKERSQS